MAATYNFDDGDVPESFEFILGGHKYRMRYPTTEELEKAIGMEGKDLLNYQYSFIESVDEGTPSITENLAGKNIVYRNRLNAAISKEFQRES